MSVETPRYTVVRSESGGYEIREYEPHIIAQTEVEGKRGDAVNRGFRVLADYIFGNNVKSESIAMTAPVSQEEVTPKGQSEKIAMTAPVMSVEAEGKYLISFVMPSQYTLETLPKPVNQRVKLVSVARHRSAVIRYSGFASQSAVDKKERELMARLARDGLIDRVRSPLRTAQYDPPWTLPFLRHNEVMVDID